MASNNIARLGVVLGLDTAEFTASIDKAIQENKKLGQAIKRDTNAAAGEIIALKNATDDYGKTLTKVQLIEREISDSPELVDLVDIYGGGTIIQERITSLRESLLAKPSFRSLDPT